jgi:hypothetical protein
MRGVAVCAEADTSALENGNGGQGQICARSPCSPNPKGRAAWDHIARPTRARTVATVSTVSTNQAIQARRDSFNGIHGTDKDPDLDHVAGFAVVGRGLETRRDDHPIAILVQDKSIHWTPPRIASVRSQTIAPMMREPKASNARAETKDWIRFMGSTEDFQDEVAFHPVAVLIAGNGRIISKDRDPVGERIPVDIVEIPFDETDGRFDVGDAEGGDVAARDALGDRGAEGLDCGGIHWIFWPRFSERGDMVQRSAAECNEKI